MTPVKDFRTKLLLTILVVVLVAYITHSWVWSIISFGITVLTLFWLAGKLSIDSSPKVVVEFSNMTIVTYPEPSQQLLDAVEEIAARSAKLPPSQRSLLDSGELHIRSTVLPNGSKEFTVWSLIEYLVFVKDSDGSNHVIKYVKADWEAEVYKRLSLYRELGGDAEARDYWGPGFDFDLTSNDQVQLATNMPSKESLGRTVPIKNTSSQGKASIVPNEIKGWNWGAFLLPLVWGIYHGVWLSLLLFIPFINILVVIVFGADGNEWAWRNRKWNSIEHFKKTQRTWALWGLGLLVLGIVLFIVTVLAAGSEEYAASTIPLGKPKSTQIQPEPTSNAGILAFQRLKQGQLEQVAVQLTALELQIAETEVKIKDAQTPRLPHVITVEEIIAALSSPNLGKKLIELKEQQSQLIANRQYLEQDIRELKHYTNIAKYYEFKISQLDELTSQLIVLRIDIDQGTAGAQQEYNRLLPQRKFMQQDIEEIRPQL